MSQVDLVVYLPILFWFLIFFSSFYILLYIYVIPLLYSALKVRQLFFVKLINDLGFYNFLLDLFQLNDFNNFKKLNIVILKKIYLIKQILNYKQMQIC